MTSSISKLLKKVTRPTKKLAKVSSIMQKRETNLSNCQHIGIGSLRQVDNKKNQIKKLIEAPSSLIFDNESPLCCSGPFFTWLFRSPP